MSKKSKSHRRHTSEPGSWTHSIFSQRSFDNLDLVGEEPDFSLTPGTSQDFSYLSTHQEYSEPNLSGIKHQRSRDYDETIIRTYHNNTTTTSTTPVKATNGGTYHSHRRVRSMPSSDLDLLDIFQSLGPTIVDNTAIVPSQQQPQVFHQESTDILDMLPALGSSMSMDVYDILKVNSEEWTDTLKEFNPEAPSPQIRLASQNFASFLSAKNPSLKSLQSLSPCSSGDFQTTMPSQVPARVVQQRFSNEFFTGDDLPDEFLSPADPNGDSKYSPPPQSAQITQVSQSNIQNHKFGGVENKGHRRNNTTGMISPRDLFPPNEVDPRYSIPQPQQPPFQVNGQFTHQHLSTIQRASISEPEYHMPQSRLKSSAEDLIEYGSKNSRGKYRCGLCGQLKANHHCPYMIEVPTRSIATQSDPPMADPSIPTSHPFYSARTVTVGGRKSGPYPSTASYLYSRAPSAYHPHPHPHPHPPTHHY